jgi:hypothetical protein
MRRVFASISDFEEVLFRRAGEGDVWMLLGPATLHRKAHGQQCPNDPGAAGHCEDRGYRYASKLFEPLQIDNSQLRNGLAWKPVVTPGQGGMRPALSEGRAIAAFPTTEMGRLPHHPFRGLLSVHFVTVCNLAESLNDPLHRRLRRSRHLLRLYDCYRLERALAGWDYLPLRNRAFTRRTLFKGISPSKRVKRAHMLRRSRPRCRLACQVWIWTPLMVLQAPVGTVSHLDYELGEAKTQG